MSNGEWQHDAWRVRVTGAKAVPEANHASRTTFAPHFQFAFLPQ